MKIKFSEHAKEQLRERKIARRLIIQTVNDPESKQKSFRKRLLLRRSFGGKILEVVTVKELDHLVIVTEYFLEGKN